MGSNSQNTTVTAAGAKHGLPKDVTEREVYAQLERLRSSAPFKSSKRCVVFLDFVVRAAVEGHSESLKERTIGVEVFGRDPNYDTNQDPVVRGTASEVRKRLAQYYQIPGHEGQLRIELPAGSYLPEFHLPAQQPAPEAPAGKSDAGLHAPARKSRWGLISAIAAGVVIVALGLGTRQLHNTNVVDQFWGPILQTPGPVLLCVGQPKVYNLIGPLEAEMERRVPSPGRMPSGDAARQKITGEVGQIVPNWDRYLALGDAMCLSDIAALLAAHQHPYHVRGGGSTSFADLRENPAVLIGGFTNDWTLRLTGQLRFSFEHSPDLVSHHVHDRLHPDNRDWQLTNVWPDWKMPIDYAIVSRVFDPTTGRVVISAAGITQYGTAAAGEFLTHPDDLQKALRHAPADWPRKNIQVVLSTKVIEGTAGPPQVLATNFW